MKGNIEMKKFFLMIMLVVATFALFAQPNKTLTIPVDTLQSNETVNFTAIKITSATQNVSIQALCTQLGGTSDGSLILKGSVDGTTYVTLNETSDFIHFYPNDTLTITNGAGWLITAKNAPYLYYRITGAGTSSDTTKVTIKYMYR